MANLLFVTCNVKPQNTSRILSLGYEFLEEYLRVSPQDEVQVFDVYRDSIQRVDLDVLNAWGRIEGGEENAIFTDEERRKMSRIWRVADQFSRCDKYVFVTHSINLFFPAEFKMYIDAICVPGRTYRVTSQGAQGRLSSLSRKSLHLHAVPSYKFGHEQDQSVAYLSSVLNFLGVVNQEAVLLEGDHPGQGAREEYEGARHRVLALARRF